MPEEALTLFAVSDAYRYFGIRHSYWGQKAGHA